MGKKSLQTELFVMSTQARLHKNSVEIDPLRETDIVEVESDDIKTAASDGTQKPRCAKIVARMPDLEEHVLSVPTKTQLPPSEHFSWIVLGKKIVRFGSDRIKAARNLTRNMLHRTNDQTRAFYISVREKSHRPSRGMVTLLLLLLLAFGYFLFKPVASEKGSEISYKVMEVPNVPAPVEQAAPTPPPQPEPEKPAPPKQEPPKPEPVKNDTPQPKPVVTAEPKAAAENSQTVEVLPAPQEEKKEILPTSPWERNATDPYYPWGMATTSAEAAKREQSDQSKSVISTPDLNRKETRQANLAGSSQPTVPQRESSSTDRGSIAPEANHTTGFAGFSPELITQTPTIPPQQSMPATASPIGAQEVNVPSSMLQYQADTSSSFGQGMPIQQSIPAQNYTSSHPVTAPPHAGYHVPQAYHHRAAMPIPQPTYQADMGLHPTAYPQPQPYQQPYPQHSPQVAMAAHTAPQQPYYTNPSQQSYPGHYPQQIVGRQPRQRVVEGVQAGGNQRPMRVQIATNDSGQTFRDYPQQNILQPTSGNTAPYPNNQQTYVIPGR